MSQLTKHLLIVAAVACLFLTLTEARAAASGRQLLTVVQQYQHCGTDLSGAYGCCRPGLICANSNPWWSMCVTPDECPNQNGYSCNSDNCGTPTTPTPPKIVGQYQHCGSDVTGSYGCCANGLICAFQNAYWSMCVTAAECPSQGGYQCNRTPCGKITP